MIRFLQKLSIFTFALVFLTGIASPIALADQPYDHNDIMTDNVFNNSGSMSTAQINSFLNSFSGSCISPNNNFTAADPTGYSPSNGFTFGGSVSAGQVIYDASQAYGLNPEVLLATMQKEQSLITGSAGCYYNSPNPSSTFSCALYGGSTEYNCTQACPYDGGCVNIATSYNCPGNCDAATEGFSQQVIHAAWKLRYSEQRSEGNEGWDVQMTNSPESGDVWNDSDDPESCYSNYMTTGTFQVCPNQAAAYWDGYATIDGDSTHMDNGATASLYDYTPNFSGNQNFIDIYEEWFGATTQTTPLMYAPGVVSMESGDINVFARGTDYREWQDWFSGGNWQINWNYIDGPDSTSSAPSAISWGPGHMDVFETRGGQLWHDWYEASEGGWQGWQPLGAPSGVWLGGSLSAVAQGNGYINVFVRGNDGRLWQTWFQNGNWTNDWNYIDGPDSAASAPTAISFGVGHMDVYDTVNGILWHDYYESSQGGWQGWQPLGGPGSASLTGQPGAVSQGNGYINVFVRGNDGRLWQTWFQNGNWTNDWNYIDGPDSAASAPTAISFGVGHMDVYDTVNGILWHDYYESSQGGWQGWQPLGEP